MIRIGRLFVIVLFAALATLAIVPAIAAPKAEIWERWTAHEPDVTTGQGSSAMTNPYP